MGEPAGPAGAAVPQVRREGAARAEGAEGPGWEGSSGIKKEESPAAWGGPEGEEAGALDCSAYPPSGPFPFAARAFGFGPAPFLFPSFQKHLSLG